MEFQLRLQEFIELVRAENNLRAITYAQKYLAPWGTVYMKELQRVFVTVAYKSTTECATYKVILFSSSGSTFSLWLAMLLRYVIDFLFGWLCYPGII